MCMWKQKLKNINTLSKITKLEAIDLENKQNKMRILLPIICIALASAHYLVLQKKYGLKDTILIH